MTTLSLQPHPGGPALADSITVEWEWVDGDRLWLRYHLEVVLDDLAIPHPAAAPGRVDGLWRTTCCELFLREPGERRYYEFNFSPSGDWAAYAFAGPRAGQGALPLPRVPEINLDASDSHFALEATVTLPDGLRGVAIDAALSAVVAERSGRAAYWALRHPDAGKPDFHHPDCFVADLSPPFGP